MPLPIGKTAGTIWAPSLPISRWDLVVQRGKGRQANVRLMSGNANDPSQMTPGVHSGG